MGSSEMRLRFAPSPTGPIHVGNAHTMLFNWLWCRSQGAKFILRFEDTDRERSKPEWEQVIISEMKWLGLDWDEGPDIGGPYAPYRQMARMDSYREYFAALQDKGAVYPCYCRPDELTEERKEADRKKVAYKYSRKCLQLTPEERAEKEALGLRPAWRLRVPDHEVVAYDDWIRGRIEFPTHSISDPVVMRASGVPLYNFAVVVDDITMQITDVVRGEGHISNTPVQVLIYRALGIQPPKFSHVSHLLNAERGKISKRKGEMSVRSFRERGILGEALFNYLAQLGWTPKGEGREFLTREETIAEFNIRDVNKAAAVFDEEKLQWMNGMYIRRKTQEEFAELALPFVVEAGHITEASARQNWAWFVEVMTQVQARVRLLDEVPSYVDFFFAEAVSYEEKSVNKFLTDAVQPFFRRVSETLSTVEWTIPAIETAIRSVMEAMALEPKQAMQPLRVAISGRAASPPLFDTIYLVGRQRVLARLDRWGQ